MKHELKPLKVYRLDNLTLGELIKRTLEDMGKIPATTLTDVPVKNYLAGFTTRSATFDKAIMKIMTAEETKKLVVADHSRDLGEISLVKMVKVFLTSDVPAEVEAAQVLMSVLTKYKGVADFEYEKESNALDKLVAELESATYSKHVAKLALARYVTRVKTSNAAFRALFAGHVATTAAKEVYDTKSLRKDMISYYDEFCLYVQSMANAAAAPAQYITVLGLLNAARKHYADRLAQHQGVIESQKKDEGVEKN